MVLIIKQETTMKNILIIDDDEYFLKSVSRVLKTIGDFNPVTPDSGVRSLLKESVLKQYDAVFLDIHMPKPDGRECLSIIKSIVPSMPVLIITGENSAETAVEYLKLGAYDFLTKPIDINRLKATLDNLFLLKSLEEELDLVTRHLLKNELEYPEHFRRIITNDEQMMRNFRYIEAIAPTSKPVMIIGETGTGKELAAEALHRCSGRKGQYVTLDVSGVDDAVFSDTLFGHVRGAFTGADKSRSGLLETAADGTIFLDEISDLPEASQIKLLRLLQTGEYYPLGSDLPKISRARIVTAVNRPVDELLAGRFRNDLYYRLSTFKIELPPLRERREDIDALARYFYAETARELRLTSEEPPKELLDILSNYSFPGNIRELKSMVEDALLNFKLGYSIPETLNRKVNKNPRQSSSKSGLKSLFGHFPTLQEITDRLITEAMEETGGKQKEAADIIGLSRQAFNRRLNILRRR